MKEEIKKSKYLAGEEMAEIRIADFNHVILIRMEEEDSIPKSDEKNKDSTRSMDLMLRFG